MAPFCLLPLVLCVVITSEAVLVRKNVNNLSQAEILTLQQALGAVNEDSSDYGYAFLAAYHGYPAQCKHGDKDVACCLHGMTVFPHWHRLYVVQLEQLLNMKGLDIGVPYWDWTQPLTHLPDLVNEQVFMDSDGGKAKPNVWNRGDIHTDHGVVHTARAVDDRLFQKVSAGEHTDLFEHILDSLEYEDYCQFEVQFEVAHSTIHYLVGGRHTYSMSHLEYTSYDPIFFLHHSNVDRLLSIYKALHDYGGSLAASECTGKQCERCSVDLMHEPLVPFSWESNPVNLTRVNSRPLDGTDPSDLGYGFDDMTLNGYDVAGIRSLLKERTSHDRAFASFRLYGIGTSANAKVKVCLPSDDSLAEEHCEFAGEFFLLGGPIEMPWEFTRPYYFDITKTVLRMGMPLDGNYRVHAELFSVNGTKLSSNILPSPTVSFRPAKGHKDPFIHVSIPGQPHDIHDGVVVRKDIDSLTQEEIYELRQAMQKFQNDRSVDGYQATAEFHGDPGKCPFPTADVRMACCIHGMPTFPHWHRLYVVQVEDALRRRGSSIGIPYWDWTKPATAIPALAGDETYQDPYSGDTVHNPFYDAEVAFLDSGIQTSRDVHPDLTQVPKFGDHTDFFDLILVALEQDNFCDFAVQFEVTHNNIHAAVGGRSPYSLSTLSYSAYDPIFVLHHSNVDRIWAIWTALQQHRGKPYKAHCAQSYVYEPLKPFAFSTPYNNNEKTFAHSVPTNVYDYEEELGYAFDSLEFGGMGIAELDDYINTNLKGKSRTFVGIMLHGIKQSAIGTVFIHDKEGKKFDAGHIALLGGPSEMAWRFDRPFRHEITDALETVGLAWNGDYTVSLELRNFDMTPVNVTSFHKPQIIHTLAEKSPDKHPEEVSIRKNVDRLTQEEVLELRHALTNLQADSSAGGYQNLGRYHGTPKWCPSPEAETKVACCLHGMPVFPHWHRLLVVQIENALRRHGYTGALPYWSWTHPMTSLPSLVSEPTYVDPVSGAEKKNPFFSAHIDDANRDTVRSVRDALYEQPGYGENTAIAKQVLLALEQEDFCTFEVQYEIAHNFIHALVGGNEKYSMASLMYTAFDPLFFLHHSNTDRLWAIWQALQKYRGKPYNTANCAIGQLRKPLSPFSLTSNINPDSMTRENSIPFKVFDYRTNFHYEYDNLDFNGLSIPQLARALEQNKEEDRVFAGFMLHGIHKSALVKFNVCRSESDCNHFAGEFYVLGDINEMEWAYDRLYKYDITDVLASLDLHYSDRYYIRYDVHDLEGHDLGQPFPTPSVVLDVGKSHLYGQEYREAVTAASQVRKDLESLNEGEVESLRAAFLSIQEDGTYENIAAFHGKPGLCERDGHKVACCVHGMPTFPSWHRLYVEQVEEALLSRGSSVAVPYWDWTKPISHLPALINDATYFNSRQHRFEPNPFFSGKVKDEDAVTTRDPQPQLFNNEQFYEQVLLAMEQDNFCDFEIQFELVHNGLHSWLGGRELQSLSSLDYTAFDPVFFLHHANTDRLWAIWQELQRFRNLPYNEADCAINLMRKPLEPFSDDNLNHGDMTHRYSRPVDTFDYRNNFHYEYDTLKFNHMNVQQLEKLLKLRQEKGRVFAGFLLHNIGMSADVEIYICVQTGVDSKKNCGKKAGVFSVLGGELEMPFMFDRVYKHDITRAVKDLGLKLDNAASFELEVKIKVVNGSYLSSSILPEPTILFVPGTGERQEPDGHVSSQLVRKNINALSPQEELSLLKAMAAMQADGSGDGYQSIASFHAIPPLCPNPSASDRHACCLHGMATFPHWHRLYTVQVEDSLRRHGSLVGIPYWDWTRQADALPGLLANPTYTDVYTGLTIDNPWYKAAIDFENSVTERDIQGDFLFKRGPLGWDTWLFKQALYALEQEDFCDFEIQFEITHNAVHSWVGGSKEKSMGHLHYASYDPAFYIHHSNTDRLWALWQALQQYRGHNPNEANCALEQMREPLRPFSFGAPYNLNKMTQEFSKPEDAFDYESHFHYAYDHLEFVGMSVSQLDDYIKEQQEHDRVFAGFLLKGFGSSALVDFDICDGNNKCFQGGYFTVLGGSAEMPWQFDRVFKYEITDQLEEHHLHHHDDYHFQVHVRAMDGTELDSSLIANPSVILELAHHNRDIEQAPPNLVRRDLNTLSERDRQSLMSALYNLEHDDSKDGWTSLASFHGAPAQCKDEHNTTIACCLHGMPTFPHWHRLFTVQVERALHRHGSSIAIPYWDWTLPITDLPNIFTVENYYDVWRDEVFDNPFARGYIPSVDAYTVRDIRPEIHLTTKDGSHSFLLDLVLSALEQTDYCDFEVQFEVMHNAIHFLVGGHQTYALSSLEYSAYDPMFFIHHSFTDKIWAVWQQLQERRHLPSNKANCALDQMSAPMRPFNMEELNINAFTREHAVPTTLFDYQDLGYAYDNLNIGGYDLEGLEHLIEDKQSRDRVFAGFLLKGVKTSGSVVLNICRLSSGCTYAGRFNLLGGPTEMPWAFDRLFKLDITDTLEILGIQPEDVFRADAQFRLQVKVFDVEGQAIPASSALPNPTIIFEPAHVPEEDVTATTVAGVAVRKDVSTLSVSEISNLREALHRVMEDHGPNGFQNIASFHGSPARCEHHGHPIACCLHGMANFPQWHRLFVKQFEDALTAQGAKIGIPYWDWTTAFTSLPSLVTEETDNPFHHGTTHNGHQTTRAPRDQLFNDPELGSESFFYRQALLVFEQTDYCDFEVQYEITHNAIHSWTGGRSPYGMSTLEYTAYDPLFLIHHSNVDRQFAIWQALQKFRGLPHKSANCAIQKLRQPMRPFSDDSNINPVTRANARATDAFDYYDKFNYHYDNLNFHGLTISELHDLLEHRKQEDRIMVEFLLHGLGAGADVIFNLCPGDHECVFAGTFAVLGGAIEMPWAFDRLFKYDVTNVFHKLNLRTDDAYHFEVEIVAVNGTTLDSGLIRPPSVQFIPGTNTKSAGKRASHRPVGTYDKLVRKDINQLSLSEATNLRDALHKLQQDQGPNGFEAIAGFHGAPFKCPATGEDKYACCVHGMPMFPHWHRLHTVQFEQALRDHGALVGIPYWDWTSPIHSLPSLFAESSYGNPFYKYHISFENQDTTRDVQDYLYMTQLRHGYNYFYFLALGTLEEDNYCDFEVQYELLHNTIHNAIGGRGQYSMATLDYSAFDPMFMIHHSSLDRIWIMWQKLQKLRHKSYSNCAGHVMDAPLHPFNYPEVNTNEFTRLHSKPSDVYNVEQFPYMYDTLKLDGKDVNAVLEDITRLREQDRVFLGMVLSGKKYSPTFVIDLLDNSGTHHRAAYVNLLGGEREMPWVYERLFKYDITEAMQKANLSTDHPVQMVFNIVSNDDGHADQAVTEYPILVERPAHVDHDIVVLPLGRQNVHLPPKIILKPGTLVKFLKVPDLPITNVIKVDSYTSFHKCVIPAFGAHKYAIGQVHDLGPGDHYFVAEDVDKCKDDKRFQITIEDE